MSKNKEKNLIYDILKNQFQTPISDTKQKVSMPPKKFKKLPDQMMQEEIPRPKPIPNRECRSDMDCTSAEICLDGYCEPASSTVPEEDDSSLPYNPDTEPMTQWAYIFSNIRECTHFIQSHNRLNIEISYDGDDRARIDGVSQSSRPHLSHLQIERMCARLRTIFLGNNSVPIGGRI